MPKEQSVSFIRMKISFLCAGDVTYADGDTYFRARGIPENESDLN